LSSEASDWMILVTKQSYEAVLTRLNLSADILIPVWPSQRK